MAEAVPNPRAIINRRRLGVELTTLTQQDLDSDTLRRRVLERLKDALEDGRAEVRRRFEARTAGGGETARALSFLADQIVRALYDFADFHVYPAPNPTSAERLAIVAVGGYGRGELAPFSDIDLLFLLPYKQTPRGEQIVEYMLYMLWDLGLKVGHSTRSVEECLRQSRADVTIRTALLEARYVWGEQPLARELADRFQREIVAGHASEFVEAKLQESQKRHLRLGDSRYLLEPNIKEGKGGLRDLHTLFWIAKYAYRVGSVEALVTKQVITEDEARRFAKAHEFLWTLRCHLHWLAGRAEERLTYDMQTEIGRRMAYTDHAGTRGVERFMKHYFLIAKEVGNLTRIFCAAIEADHQRLGFIDRARRRLSRLGLGPRALGQRALEGFEVDGGRINVAHDRMFAEDPVNMMRLFELAQRHDLDVHPHALQLITRDLRRIDDRMRADPEANRLFLEILAAPRDSERVLRRMNEAGVFGRFLPDFGRVVAQMQYDMYHVYTVDEHTIFALGIMHRIEEGKLGEDHPLASEIVHKVASRRALYVAVLLHDIAKGRGGDHSILGEQVAHKVCPRLGLTDEETETVAWLVRWHLLLSNTAFKRDINDDKTIADFAQIVQSPERLRLLLCLTVADIRGVGPGIWNHWKASLLRQLYYRAEETLSGTPTAEGTARRVAAAQAALRVALPDWSEEEFQAHCARGYPGYWLGLDTATQVRHARLVREAERADLPLVVDRRIDVRQAVTEVTIYTADHPGLFGQLAGAFAVNAANIADAKIFTLANGMALDTFWIQDVEGKAFDRPDRLARLSVSIEQAIDGRLRPIQELSRRKSATPRTRELRAPPRVVIDDKASATHTVIEVNGRDRTGLLYELARALTELGLQISTAKISTYGANVVDVFYVKDIFGLKVGHEAKLAQIRERLLAVLSEPSAQEAPAAPPVRERRARVRAAG